MKNIAKITVLFLLVFSLCGCSSNYITLNDMAIVSSILIDKEDDKYISYIELYKEEKSENKSKKISYFVNGTGKTIKSSILNATESVSKTLYFVHINAIIFSKNIAENNLQDVFDYLVTRVQLNSNYYLLISDNIKELMDAKDNDNPILGEKINKLVNNSTNSGVMVNFDFLEKLKNFTSSNKDIYLNKVEVKDDNVTIDKGYYFSDTKLVGNLTEDDLKLINLFKDTKNIYFTYFYKDAFYTLKIDQVNVKYDIKDKIYVTLNIKANVDTSQHELDLDKIEVIREINKHTKNSLNDKLTVFINNLKENNSDILGINNYIYRIYGRKKLDFFKDETVIKVNVNINKKGLIHSTLGGQYEKK